MMEDEDELTAMMKADPEEKLVILLISRIYNVNFPNLIINLVI